MGHARERVVKRETVKGGSAGGMILKMRIREEVIEKNGEEEGVMVKKIR